MPTSTGPDGAARRRKTCWPGLRSQKRNRQREQRPRQVCTASAPPSSPPPDSCTADWKLATGNLRLQRALTWRPSLPLVSAIRLPLLSAVLTFAFCILTFDLTPHLLWLSSTPDGKHARRPSAPDIPTDAGPNPAKPDDSVAIASAAPRRGHDRRPSPPRHCRPESRT